MAEVKINKRCSVRIDNFVVGVPQDTILTLSDVDAQAVITAGNGCLYEAKVIPSTPEKKTEAILEKRERVELFNDLSSPVSKTKKADKTKAA